MKEAKGCEEKFGQLWCTCEVCIYRDDLVKCMAYRNKYGLRVLYDREL